MPSSGPLRLVVLVRTDVSEESIASIIRVTRTSEPETTLKVTINRSTLGRRRHFSSFISFEEQDTQTKIRKI
jgi:hypothetical protein